MNLKRLELRDKNSKYSHLIIKYKLGEEVLLMRNVFNECFIILPEIRSRG